MSTINLLPWREQRRRAHQQRFWIVLVFGVLAAIALQWAISGYLISLVDAQQARVSSLEQRSIAMDGQLNQLAELKQQHAELMSESNQLERKVVRRVIVIQWMNLLPQLVPDAVYLDTVRLKGNQITLSGFSDSTTAITSMLENIERSEACTSVKVHTIVHQRRYGLEGQRFQLSIQLAPFHSSYPESQPDV
ncbi:PilN domain-containing protein [Vibrio sp. WXL210]|uniref:PilN domain-containing protein n=1 Tax=Vibrio sp. WXL210 TaxID=3450709 RepID=UPI003EC8F1B6